MDISRKLNANKRFFDRLAPMYDRRPVSSWLQGVQRKVIEIMQPKATIAILDVGCGTGASLKMLLDQGHQGKLVGVDLSSPMLEKARQKLGKKVQLYLANSARLPFKAGSIDLIMCTEAFHHFPEPGKALNEMVRVLRKGGKLYLTDLHFYFHPLHWVFQKLEPGCVHVYTIEEMKRLFEKAGLKKIKQQRIGRLIVLTRGEK